MSAVVCVPVFEGGVRHASRRVAARCLAALAILLALSACSPEQDPTEVIVVVDSDLTVGTDLTALRVQAFDATGKTTLTDRVIALLERDGQKAKYQFPLSYGLTPGDDVTEFRLVVTGKGPTGAGGALEDVVEQQVWASFRPHEKLLLRVFLGAACKAKLCREADGTLGKQTCRAGTCAEVPLEMLPKVGPGSDYGYVRPTPIPVPIMDGGPVQDASIDATPGPDAAVDSSKPECDDQRDRDVVCSLRPDGTTIEWPTGAPMGACKTGTRSCANGRWGPCTGAVAPASSDSCEPGDDSNCNGTLNDGCECTAGATRPCGMTKGNCKQGTQTCSGSTWSAGCVAAVVPASADLCDPNDDATCNGIPNEGCACVNGATTTCGAVMPGLETCLASKPITCAGGTWPTASCTGTCNDCPAGACGNGTCVDSFNTYSCTCSGKFAATADGKACASTDPCNGLMCGANATCAAGTCACNAGFVKDSQGLCVDACATVNCGPGGTCSGGSCSCASGYQLQNGACVLVNNCKADSCTNGMCVNGTNTFTCMCNSGYDGTGTMACTKHLWCPATGACANGMCVEGASDYSCMCNPGYDGTGSKACTLHDICQTNHGGCSSLATCTNIVGGRTCKCPSTHNGDGVGPSGCVERVVGIALGVNVSCAAMATGTAKCWGQNSSGQLGDGTMVDRATPTTVSGITGVTGVTVGSSHACVVLTDQSVRCWGANFVGQLGNSTMTDSLSAVAVSGLPKVTQITAVNNHSCALGLDGTVRCWGANWAGQCGDGSTGAGISTPVVASGISDAVGVSAGGEHTCALSKTGGVRCWGYNANGEVGDGTTGTNRLLPVTVTGLSNVAQVKAGNLKTCARLGDGTLRCWGNNSYGQLGDGTMADRSQPVVVSGISNAIEISSGYPTCAVLSDGTVRCWGANSNGQLGDGSTVNSATPVMATGISTATIVRAGYKHACALLADATVRCWGDNSFGQLGNGTATSSAVPVLVTGF